MITCWIKHHKSTTGSDADDKILSDALRIDLDIQIMTLLFKCWHKVVITSSISLLSNSCYCYCFYSNKYITRRPACSYLCFLYINCKIIQSFLKILPKYFRALPCTKELLNSPNFLLSYLPKYTICFIQQSYCEKSIQFGQ